jgi:hypothetical protein
MLNIYIYIYIYIYICRISVHIHICTSAHTEPFAHFVAQFVAESTSGAESVRVEPASEHVVRGFARVFRPISSDIPLVRRSGERGGDRLCSQSAVGGV